MSNPTPRAGEGIVAYLNRIGMDSSFTSRSRLALQYGITNYTGTASQNNDLLLRVAGSGSGGSGSSVEGNNPPPNSGEGIVSYLDRIGIDSSFSNRARLAAQNGLSNYSGTASQNNELLLRISNSSSGSNTRGNNPPVRAGEGIVSYLNRIGIDSSYTNRARLAVQYNISNYTGTAVQNNKLLSLLIGSGRVESENTSGNNPRPFVGEGLVSYLNRIGVNSSYTNRNQLATQYGISNYSGTAAQNNDLLLRVANGRSGSGGASGSNPAPRAGEGIVSYMDRIGINSSFSNRTRLAIQNGIANYIGSAAQNNELLLKIAGGNLTGSGAGRPLPHAGEGIVTYMNRIGIDSSYTNRSRLATQYGISGYTGTAAQNNILLLHIANGTSSGSSGSDSGGSRPSPQAGEGIVSYMNRVGMDSSYANRERLARQYGIANYRGTASQNNELLFMISGSSGGTGSPGAVQPGFIHGGSFLDLTVRSRIIPRNNYNRPGRSMSPRYITIHETANTSVGANAAMHASYVRNPSTRVSWHYSVDSDNYIYQHLPINETAYHAGDGGGDGNTNSIGIELCVNSDGNFTRTRRNAAALVKWLMNRHNIPLSNVVTHNKWSGKRCPANLLSVFNDFKQQVQNSNIGGADNKPAQTFRVQSMFDTRHVKTLSADDLSYSYSYPLTVGNFKGNLSGELLFNNESKWTLSASNAIKGEFAIKNHIDQFIRRLASDFGLDFNILQKYYEGAISSMDKLTEARTRYMQIDPQITPPFFNVTYFQIETKRQLHPNIHLFERLEINEAKFDFRNSRFLNQMMIVSLLIMGAVLIATAPVSVPLTVAGTAIATIALLLVRLFQQNVNYA
ncbi:N-acetylmuramoyl-L-alanine amidase family protein [Shouchella miscanthi]|uniref:N-acetylmuramoyl-L-alanine amidase n=1 Tax=Shouchella miscanthi TaxID=2598861 RepID=A0ABU6NQ13_9BACI|nr:N-acetylmuramoyl-L-alanine amidase [Shouchella miscanthi]MED4130286.1 N-acetylmuramoyl-L-alanine amidase [Shouchella miscanthi]